MEMALDEMASEYFASMSELARRVVQESEAVRSANGELWADLTWQEQERLLDEHFIDARVADKYAENQTTEGLKLPDCFPVLKINCGEKIVVDFEHEDGWTWTDEHSAPFSWRSKSQQDLTLADLDVATSPGVTDDPPGRRGHGGAASRSRSPDKSHRGAGGPGGASGDKNEVEMMFEKFGLRAAASDDEAAVSQTQGVVVEGSQTNSAAVTSPSHLYDEKSKLLTDSVAAISTDGAVKPKPRTKDKKSPKESIETNKSGSKVDRYGKVSLEKILPPNTRAKSGKTEGHDKACKRGEKSTPRGEVHRESSLALSENIILVERGAVQSFVASPGGGDNGGGGVYLAMPGESSTDEGLGAPPEVSSAQGEGVEQGGRVITSQPRASSVGLSAVGPSPSGGSQPETAVKTGFDFLDDW